MQHQCSADPARIRRGIALAKAGAVRQAGDLFLVQSSGGQQTYTVSLDNINGETCSCPDWRRHGFGHVCKHVSATTYALAKGLCRRAKTAKPKTGQRHKAEDRDSLRGIGQQINRDQMLTNLARMEHYSS